MFNQSFLQVSIQDFCFAFNCLMGIKQLFNAAVSVCRVRHQWVTCKNCATSGVSYHCMSWWHLMARLMSLCLSSVWKHVNTAQQAKVA